MANSNLSVRELEHKDIRMIADYWFTATPEYLNNMGVDIAKMPSHEDFTAMLATQLTLPYNEKRAYAVIWEVNDKPIGHSNLNPVEYGGHGYMHLHIWKPEDRKSGYGTELIKLTLPYFFNNMQLKKIYCQPYALNGAPNKTLYKVGFKFVKEYITTPGAITFEQPVNLWEIEK